MKNSVEFLKSKLNELSNRYRGLKIRYEYVEKTNLHLIETKPYNFYDDLSYLKAEEDLESSFEMEFPNDRILFLGEYPLYEIKNVSFSFESETFKKVKSEITANTLNIIIPSYKELGINNYILNQNTCGQNNYALAA